MKYDITGIIKEYPGIHIGVLVGRNMNNKKNYQFKKIKSSPLIQKDKGIVIVNDKMICFHPKSKSKLVIRNYKYFF